MLRSLPRLPMAGLLMLVAWTVVPIDPADAERHFINTYSDGPFAFDEDENGLPPAQEAPAERLPDRADERSGAAR